MDIARAIECGQLVKATETENVLPANAMGRTSGRYTAVATICANDLATDANPSPVNQTVPIGIIWQSGGDLVVAIRGTAGILEWVHDLNFGMVSWVEGQTEDGFTDLYRSMNVNGVPVATALPTLIKDPLTVCGHSLGGALATLLAFDLAPHSPTVFTFGSPRVGDQTFVNAFNGAVPNSYRIENRLDIVPKLPLTWFGYRHVANAYELNPPVGDNLTLSAEHQLDTYLKLLTKG